MTATDVQEMFKLRFDDAGKKVWMLPQDVIDNTIRAYSVSPTSANGYAGDAPTGRYFMPANGPDCIEVDNGADYGTARHRSTRRDRADVPAARHQNREANPDRRHDRLRVCAEMLNAFNQANFVPVGGIGRRVANYEVTTLTGTNTSRVMQIVFRVNW